MSILNIKFDLVEITWDDASSLEHGWVDPNDEKPQPQLVKTVGFLVNESEHYLVIASTTDGSWVNGRFQIPKGMVRSCKPLRRKRKAKDSGLARAQAEAAAQAQGELPGSEESSATQGAAQPMEPKPVEPALAKGAPTILEDLLAKAGEAATAMKKADERARSVAAEPEVPRAA
ncbi:MAG TPA: hypothetical protein VH105_23175 [Burkholderiales bacterium]|jgi:hypothetical protein|nr:hypothetical protein [Burkholderiales bacterium]